VVLKDAGLDIKDLTVMGVSPQVAVQSLVGERVDAAFLFEPQASIAQLIAPVKQIYEIGAVWPFPCMVTITSGETLKNKKDLVWKSLDAQRQAIELLQDKPDEAAKLIAGYFISEPTLKTLEHGDLPREQIISKAIQSQTFNAALTAEDLGRMQDIADIMQAQGALKTQDGSAYDVSKIVDLEWQEARKL
jgi:NitT/TauT family transport system substrate-binding protein